LSFIPPTTLYSLISGFKYDAAAGEGIAFTDGSFEFEIRDADDVVVATAVSSMDGTGALIFKYVGDDTEYDNLELEEGTYTIIELGKTGYDFVRYELLADLDPPEIGYTPSFIFESGEVDQFTFIFYNQEKPPEYRDETAYAYPGDMGGNALNTIRGQKNWGWYLTAQEGTFDIYAGAGQNDISKGTFVGTVTFSIVGDYYAAELDLLDGILLDGEHFGVYKKTSDIPKGPGLFTNMVKASDATVMVYHLGVQIPVE
jgi:hypothetical protein